MILRGNFGKTKTGHTSAEGANDRSTVPTRKGYSVINLLYHLVSPKNIGF